MQPGTMGDALEPEARSSRSGRSRVRTTGEPNADATMKRSNDGIDSYEHGVPSWVDLGTPDPAKTAEFYSALFGWTVQQGPPEAGGYAIAELRGRPVAGLGPQQNPGPPVWSTYVNVDDADKAVAAKATEAGGTVIVPPDGRDGRRPHGVLRRPGGRGDRRLAAEGAQGCRHRQRAGHAHVERARHDRHRGGAETFYDKVFGWGAVTHGEGAGAYTEFQVAGRSIAGMMAKPAEMPPEMPPYWGVYFDVADTDATAKVSESAGSADRQWRPRHRARTLRGRVDPTGAAFSVITMKTS